jgi:hypothetical protein
VKDGGCNNEIVYSASTNKGASFSGTTIEPRQLPVVTEKADRPAPTSSGGARR